MADVASADRGSGGGSRRGSHASEGSRRGSQRSSDADLNATRQKSTRSLASHASSQPAAEPELGLLAKKPSTMGSLLERSLTLSNLTAARLAALPPSVSARAEAGGGAAVGTWERRLDAVYNKHVPTKKATMPVILHKFRNREEDLFDRLAKKYADPSATDYRRPAGDDAVTAAALADVNALREAAGVGPVAFSSEKTAAAAHTALAHLRDGAAAAEADPAHYSVHPAALTGEGATEAGLAAAAIAAWADAAGDAARLLHPALADVGAFVAVADAADDDGDTAPTYPRAACVVLLYGDLPAQPERDEPAVAQGKPAVADPMAPAGATDVPEVAVATGDTARADEGDAADSEAADIRRSSNAGAGGDVGSRRSSNAGAGGDVGSRRSSKGSAVSDTAGAGGDAAVGEEPGDGDDAADRGVVSDAAGDGSDGPPARDDETGSGAGGGSEPEVESVGEQEKDFVGGGSEAGVSAPESAMRGASSVRSRASELRSTSLRSHAGRRESGPDRSGPLQQDGSDELAGLMHKVGSVTISAPDNHPAADSQSVEEMPRLRSSLRQVGSAVSRSHVTLVPPEDDSGGFYSSAHESTDREEGGGDLDDAGLLRAVAASRHGSVPEFGEAVDSPASGEDEPGPTRAPKKASSSSMSRRTSAPLEQQGLVLSTSLDTLTADTLPSHTPALARGASVAVRGTQNFSFAQPPLPRTASAGAAMRNPSWQPPARREYDTPAARDLHEFVNMYQTPSRHAASLAASTEEMTAAEEPPRDPDVAMGAGGFPARIMNELSFQDLDGETLRFMLYSDGSLRLRTSFKNYAKPVDRVKLTRTAGAAGRAESVLSIPALKLAVSIPKPQLRPLAELLDQAGVAHNLAAYLPEGQRRQSAAAHAGDGPHDLALPEAVAWQCDGEHVWVTRHPAKPTEALLLTVAEAAAAGGGALDMEAREELEVHALRLLKGVGSEEPSVYFPEAKRVVDIPAAAVPEAVLAGLYRLVVGMPLGAVKHDLPPPLGVAVAAASAAAALCAAAVGMAEYDEQVALSIHEVMKQTGSPRARARLYLQAYGNNMDVDAAVAAMYASSPLYKDTDGEEARVAPPRFDGLPAQPHPLATPPRKKAAPTAHRMFAKGFHLHFYRGDMPLRGIGYIGEIHRRVDRENRVPFHAVNIRMTVLGGDGRAVAALFPEPAPPGAADPAKLVNALTTHEREQLSLDGVARKLFVTTFLLTLKCLGLEVDLRNGRVRRPTERTADAGWSRPACSDRFRVLDTKEGLPMRKLVTRMIRSCYVFGYGGLAAGLVDFLVRAVVVVPNHLSHCRDIAAKWVGLIEDPAARDALLGTLSGAVSSAPWRSSFSPSPPRASARAAGYTTATRTTEPHFTQSPHGYEADDAAAAYPSVPAVPNPHLDSRASRRAPPTPPECTPATAHPTSEPPSAAATPDDPPLPRTHPQQESVASAPKTPVPALDLTAATERSGSRGRRRSLKRAPSAEARQATARHPSPLAAKQRPAQRAVAKRDVSPALPLAPAEGAVDWGAPPPQQQQQQPLPLHDALYLSATAPVEPLPAHAALQIHGTYPRIRLQIDPDCYRLIIEGPAAAVRVALTESEVTMWHVGDPRPAPGPQPAAMDELTTHGDGGVVLSGYERTVALPTLIKPSLAMKEPYDAMHTVCTFPRDRREGEDLQLLERGAAAAPGAAFGGGDDDDLGTRTQALSPRRPRPAVTFETFPDHYRVVVKGPPEALSVKPDVSSLTVTQLARVLPPFTHPATRVLYDELGGRAAPAHLKHLDADGQRLVNGFAARGGGAAPPRVLPPATRCFPLTRPAVPARMTVAPHGVSHTLITLPILPANAPMTL